MERVVLKDHSVVLGGCHPPINFYHQDFYKVFGIPCGERDIHGSDANTTPEAVEFMRTSIGWNDRSDHSMKTIEAFIAKDVVETSSRLEKDCFKMAFVVFVMGNLFAPCSKYDYTIIDYWGALKDTDCIEKFNWCKYAFDALLDSVAKLQADVENNAPVSILYGCHLFLQVFLLDNVDLGILNLKHNHLPRIELFNAEQIRRMIVMCRTKHNGKSTFTLPMARHGTLVCYTRHKFVSENEESYIRRAPAREKWSTPVADSMKKDVPIEAACYSTPIAGAKPCIAVSTPNQFTNFLHTHHSSTAASPLGWALKEHNAKCVQLANKLREDIIAENFRFTTKVIREYEQRHAMSVGSHAVTEPIVVRCGAAKTEMANTDPIAGRKLDLGGSPAYHAAASSLSGIKSKAGKTESSSSFCNKKSRMDAAPDAPAFDLGLDDINEGSTSTKLAGTLGSHVAEFARNLVGQLLMICEEVGDSDGQVVFGQTNTLGSSPNSRQVVEHSGFNLPPWSANRKSRSHDSLVRKAISGWIETRTNTELASEWVSHPVPRYIAVVGDVIKSQVYLDAAMDHEMASLVIRRLGQMDDPLHKDTPGERWRKIMEPDFALNALAGESITEIASIQQQFYGPAVNYNIANCQMFFVPTVMPHGWCCLCWNMEEKIIIVIDPTAFTPDDGNTLNSLQFATDQIHNALFDCFEKFFNKWHCNRNGWRRKFPLLTTTKFSSNDTGMCVVHIIRHFNGTSLAKQLTKGLLKQERESLLIELIHMEGNTAMLQLEGLDVVAQASEAARVGKISGT